MARVVITGATGLCGRSLVGLLGSSPEHEIYTVARGALERERHAVVDLRVPVPTGALPTAVDAVIHAAAVVDEQRDDFALVEENLRTTFHAASYAVSARARVFIYVSSVAVYGAVDDQIVSETRATAPRSMYGLSKLLGERLAEAKLASRSAVAILRLGYLLGPGLPSRYAVRRLYDHLLDQRPLRLQNADTTRFPFVDAEDVARACSLIIERPSPGTFNVVGTEQPTVRATVSALEELTGRQAVIAAEHGDAPPMPTAYSNEHIRRTLGIEFTPLGSTLARALATSSR